MDARTSDVRSWDVSPWTVVARVLCSERIREWGVRRSWVFRVSSSYSRHSHKRSAYLRTNARTWARRSRVLARIGRGMLGVGLPVMEIGSGQGPIVDHEQVFTVLLLGGFGEIKAPGNEAVGAKNHVL